MSDQLQITDLTLGEGKECVKGALITTHYTGTLEDGTVFDSSHQRGRPFQCVIGTGRVIKGWDLGVAGMKVGDGLSGEPTVGPLINQEAVEKVEEHIADAKSKASKKAQPERRLRLIGM